MGTRDIGLDTEGGQQKCAKCAEVDVCVWREREGGGGGGGRQRQRQRHEWGTSSWLACFMVA